MKIFKRICSVFISAAMFLGSFAISAESANVYDIMESRLEEGFVSDIPFAAANGIGTYTITTEKLNVRSEATTSSDIIGNLYEYDRVYVSEVSYGWGKIKFGKSTGWISLVYAEKYEKYHTLSDEGLSLLKSLEGFSKYAYWDYKQYTIGYGSSCEENEYPNGITEAEASVLLLKQLRKYERNLDVFLYNNNISVNQNQYDALVSFTYNLGNPWAKWDDFKLKSILKDGAWKYTDAQIEDAFLEFKMANGQVLQGLINRRKAEAALFSAMAFIDITPSDWYYSAVRYAFKNGVVSGTSATTFSPNQSYSRAMLVTMLAAMSNYDKNKYEVSDFVDVDITSWYGSAVQWASENGITGGTGSDVNGKYFSPNVFISRQDCVLMIYKYAIMLKLDMTIENENAYKNYHDSANIAGYAQKAVNWCISKGCIAGDNLGNFNPRNSTTRAEGTQIIVSFMQKVLGR